MQTIERRTFDFAELRLTSGPRPHLIGYAAVFDEQSQNLGGFVEKIDPHAFDAAIGGDVRALWNHDPNFVLGRTQSGTLRLRVDRRGLHVDIDPPATSWAGDFLKSIARGDVDQMSFGFNAVRDQWTTARDGKAVRRLLEVKLHDVSPVTFAAYPQTTVGVRAEAARHTRAGRLREHVGARAQTRLLRLRLDLAEAEAGAVWDPETHSYI